jgi:glycolate oxidase FAD binding subunit
VSSATVVERALADACGASAVRPATPTDAISGATPPRFVAAPADTATLSATLTTAAKYDLTVVVRGGGTKADWGNPPTTVDLIIDTSRMAGVVEHYVDDQVVTVGSGTVLADLQAALARHGQRVAMDPCSPRATIGGLLASGEAGPLRFRHGAPRDHVLGMEFVRADGSVAHSGGRVVKNVAGYDIAKLLCGSYGTLAVMATATLRVQPIPAARAWVTRPIYTPGEVNEVVSALLNSRIEPAAIELDHPSGWGGSLSVLLEGSVNGVASRTGDAERLLGTDSSTSATPPGWWGRYPFGSDDVAIKIAAPVADMHAVIYSLRDAVGIAMPVRGSAGVGVCYAALPVTVAATAIDAIRISLIARGGTCVVLSAPEGVRERLDMWGPVGGIDIMRAIKRRFDPAGMLAPGRFVGGI